MVFVLVAKVTSTPSLNDLVANMAYFGSQEMSVNVLYSSKLFQTTLYCPSSTFLAMHNL